MVTAVTGELARVVRERREELGYASLRAFSRATGVNVATLSRLESGAQDNVADETLARIAQKLNMSSLELRQAAGLLTQDELSKLERRPSVEDAVRVDPDLTEVQKEAVLTVYYAFIPSKKPPNW